MSTIAIITPNHPPVNLPTFPLWSERLQSSSTEPFTPDLAALIERSAQVAAHDLDLGRATRYISSFATVEEANGLFNKLSRSALFVEGIVYRSMNQVAGTIDEPHYYLTIVYSLSDDEQAQFVDTDKPIGYYPQLRWTGELIRFADVLTPECEHGQRGGSAECCDQCQKDGPTALHVITAPVLDCASDFWGSPRPSKSWQVELRVKGMPEADYRALMTQMAEHGCLSGRVDYDASDLYSGFLSVLTPDEKACQQARRALAGKANGMAIIPPTNQTSEKLAKQALGGN